MLLKIFRVDVFEKGNFLPVTSLVYTVLTFCTTSLKFLICSTDVISFSRLHACETLISETPMYPLIYGSCSIIKHHCYVYTSYSMIIYPLINCLQDIIMHIKCEMQSPYARSMLMSYTKFIDRGRKRADELILVPD